MINLIIPPTDQQSEDDSSSASSVDAEEEKLVVIDQIATLVVAAMKNFCSSEAILNRACLVLHNISLCQAYHTALLASPNCYQMLTWCLHNYKGDPVLQQSAKGALHRLQVTLSNDSTLCAAFNASLRDQTQLSLQEVHDEGKYLQEQQEQARRRREDV